MYNLANRYRLGDGVAKDLDLAIKWFRSSAALNNDGACTILAQMYLTGYSGVPIDQAEGKKWERRATELCGECNVGGDDARDAMNACSQQ